MAIVYVALVIITVSFSQLLLKIGANKSVGKGSLAPYINIYTAVAYGLYLINTVVTVYALKYVDLDFLYATTSLKFLTILVLSIVFLKEKTSKSKIMAVLLISAGVVVFNL
jgi:small multidrug resistance pump